jgi:hypothetical protein
LATKELADSSQLTVSNFLFHQGIYFTELNMILFPHPPFFLFPRLQIKLIGLHFGTIVMIKAEPQAVLNTQNTTSRMHLENGSSAGNGAYSRNGTTSKVTVASRPKVSFYQMAAPVPEIMDGESDSMILYWKNTNTANISGGCAL